MGVVEKRDVVLGQIYRPSFDSLLNFSQQDLRSRVYLTFTAFCQKIRLIDETWVEILSLAFLLIHLVSFYFF